MKIIGPGGDSVTGQNGVRSGPSAATPSEPARTAGSSCRGLRPRVPGHTMCIIESDGRKRLLRSGIMRCMAVQASPLPGVTSSTPTRAGQGEQKTRPEMVWPTPAYPSSICTCPRPARGASSPCPTASAAMSPRSRTDRSGPGRRVTENGGSGCCPRTGTGENRSRHAPQTGGATVRTHDLATEAVDGGTPGHSRVPSVPAAARALKSHSLPRHANGVQAVWKKNRFSPHLCGLKSIRDRCSPRCEQLR